MPRHTYTPEQIDRFYDRIELPQRHRHVPGDESRSIARGSEGFELLAALQRHTLCNIPFENLELHYSRTKVIDIHPELLFQKIITQKNGRGGYCMENNTFFATVLRTIGFEIYSTGGRVNSMASPNGDLAASSSSNGEDIDGGMFFGLGHMVNIVTILGTRYLVDVGFGAGTAVRPMPLEEGTIHLNIKPSQEVRLRFDALEQFENKESKVWILERRNSPDEPWATMYCFPDKQEFLPADFMVLNYYTSSASRTFFTYMIMVVKFILSEDGEEVIGETVLVGDKFHRRVRGEKVKEVKLKTEAERVDILETDVGIRLDENQQSGILGMVSMLSG